MAKPRLLLIRHSQTTLDLSVPAKNWSLSVEGIRRAKRFAAVISGYNPTRIYSSSEQKAEQTATLIASQVGCPYAQIEGVHEHDRSTITEMPGDLFRQHVESLLRDPQHYQFGGENGTAVVARFEAALNHTLARHLDELVAVVTHGTAITLFLAAHGLVDPVPYWNALQQPALLLLEARPWQLLETINPQW